MKLDYQLLILIIIFNIIGLSFFYSVSLPYSSKYFNDPLYYFKKYLIFNIIIPFLFFVLTAYFVSWSFLKNISKFIFFINLIFLILPFFNFFKLPYQETARWFYFYGFSFQPSEFMKLSMLLFLSSVLPLFKRSSEYFYISLILILIVSLIIYFQPALSNLLIFLSALIGAFISLNFDFKKLTIIFFLIIILVAFSFLWSYRSERIKNLIKGDEQNISFQLKQSRLAIGSGGIMGKGLGNSELKLIGLPLMISDNIFAIFAEETGFVGSLILIVSFLFLIFKILFKAFYLKDDSQKFFSTGVACWLSAQVFIHLMANLIIPTGVPLPFFSYGPSSQLSLMIALAIIVNFKS
jgi:cell division protein FtsW (lipid II flippase)